MSVALWSDSELAGLYAELCRSGYAEPQVIATAVAKAAFANREAFRRTYLELNEEIAHTNLDLLSQPDLRPAWAETTVDWANNLLYNAIANDGYDFLLDDPAKSLIIAAARHRDVQLSNTAPRAPYYLMFVGGSFYTKESFLAEAKRLGVSKRISEKQLPSDLACQNTERQLGGSFGSRIYLAYGASHSSAKNPKPAEIFAYFVPDRLEFVTDGSVEISASLKLRPDTQVVGFNAAVVRGCGTRKVGGTYLVTNADSPIVELDPVVAFDGAHFRGIRLLTDDQVAAIETGRGISTWKIAQCTGCAEPTQVTETAWLRCSRNLRHNRDASLLCPDCQAAQRRERTEARRQARLAEKGGEQ